jgi:hypothetical protein
MPVRPWSLLVWRSRRRDVGRAHAELRLGCHDCLKRALAAKRDSDRSRSGSPGCSPGRRGYSGVRAESQVGTCAVIGVTFVITVEDPSADFSQIVRSDVFTAPRTKGFPARCPAVYQNIPHVALLGAKQNTASEGWRTLRGFIAPPAGAACRAWTGVADTRQRQLHSRILHNRFIAQPPVSKVPAAIAVPLDVSSWISAHD